MSLSEEVADASSRARVNATGFDAFYATNWDATVRLAFLLTGSKAMAEDAAQEAFLRVHRRFERIDSPKPFLRTVVVNICRDVQRSDRRAAVRNMRLVDRPGSATAPTDPDDLGPHVDRLPYRQRAVVVLRYWADLSEADIAATLGCRPGTVKTLASRALATLRKEVTR